MICSGNLNPKAFKQMQRVPVPEGKTYKQPNYQNCLCEMFSFLSIREGILRKWNYLVSWVQIDFILSPLTGMDVPERYNKPWECFFLFLVTYNLCWTLQNSQARLHGFSFTDLWIERTQAVFQARSQWDRQPDLKRRRCTAVTSRHLWRLSNTRDPWW